MSDFYAEVSNLLGVDFFESDEKYFSLLSTVKTTKSDIARLALASHLAKEGDGRGELIQLLVALNNLHKHVCRKPDFCRYCYHGEIFLARFEFLSNFSY